MSRYRSRTSSSTEDQDIQRLCDDAAKSLRKAIQIASVVRNDRTYRSRHARKVMNELERLLGGLEQISRIDSPLRSRVVDRDLDGPSVEVEEDAA